MTIKQFFESKNLLVIHCDTEEKAIKLLEAFNKEGYRWCNGESYTKINNWEDYKEKTCYSNNHMYGFMKFYQDMSFKVLEFENIEM